MNSQEAFSEASVTATKAGVSRVGCAEADRRIVIVRIIATSFIGTRRQPGRPVPSGASVGLPIRADAGPEPSMAG